MPEHLVWARFNREAGKRAQLATVQVSLMQIRALQMITHNQTQRILPEDLSSSNQKHPVELVMH